MTLKIRRQIEIRYIECLKKNVYGLSLLPSALISRLFHVKATRYLGFMIFFVLFGMIDKDYRKFSKAILHHLRGKGSFHGQQLQDLAAIAFGLGDEDGSEVKFFLDVGAAYPFKYSNSAELQRLGWHGILIEPNPTLYAELKEVRSTPNVRVFQYAIGESDGISKLINSGPLSSLVRSGNTDIYDELRKEISSNSSNPIVEVNMLTPRKLLQLSDTPKKIQFLSIDTEGHELEILNNFPFDDYDVHFLTCEHNFEWSYLDRIDSLMAENGFRRVMPFWSAQDAWYLKI